MIEGMGICTRNITLSHQSPGGGLTTPGQHLRASSQSAVQGPWMLLAPSCTSFACTAVPTQMLVCSLCLSHQQLQSPVCMHSCAHTGPFTLAFAHCLRRIDSFCLTSSLLFIRIKLWQLLQGSQHCKTPGFLQQIRHVCAVGRGDLYNEEFKFSSFFPTFMQPAVDWLAGLLGAALRLGGGGQPTAAPPTVLAAPLPGSDNSDAARRR